MVNRRDAAEESVSRPMMASFAWLRRGELPLSTLGRRLDCQKQPFNGSNRTRASERSFLVAPVSARKPRRKRSQTKRHVRHRASSSSCS